MAWVYVYEPDPGVRDLLGLQIERLGHRVAREGEEFDIALVETATLEGQAVASGVRQRLPKAPLIVVSVRSSEPKTESLEPFAHLVKPVSLRVLGSAIEAAREMLVPNDVR